MINNKSFREPIRPDSPPCPACGSGDFRFAWQEFANGTRHIRMTCRACGRFIKYQPQLPWAVAEADDFELERAADEERVAREW
jgi:hypothetical protein